jgi:hypothetical protein
LIGCFGCGRKYEEDKLVKELQQEMAEQGYNMRISTPKEPNEESPLLSDTVYIIEQGNFITEKLAYLTITQTAAGLKSVNLSMSPDPKNENMALVRYFDAALMHVYDASVKPGEESGETAINAVIQAQNNDTTYNRNGITYYYNLGKSYIHFNISFPRNNYAASLKEVEKERSSEIKPFDFSKQAFLDSLGALIAAYGYSLVPKDADYEKLAGSADLLLLDKPEVYALVQEIGFTDGYVLLYGTKQKLTDIVFLQYDEGTRLLDYEDLSAMIIRCCDSSFRNSPKDTDQDDALKMFDQLEDDHTVEQNGLRYVYRSYDVEIDSISIDVP